MTHPAMPAPARPRVVGKVVTGVACLVLAFLGVLGTFVLLIFVFFDTDASVPVDGRPHTVSLEGDDRRVLFVEEGGDATCEVRDSGGDVLRLDPVGAEVTRSVNGEDRVGSATFAPSGGDVEVTCTGSDRLDVEIAESPTSGDNLVLLLVGFGASAILGVVGLVLLVVALVKRLSPRSAH